MTWTWRLEQADGSEIEGESPVHQPAHANQSDAESWVGETWRELAAGGVAQVTLFEDERKVYKMSLAEA